MDAKRKEKVARATAELLQAVRELAHSKSDRDRRQRRLVDGAPQAFLRAVEAFAEAIAN